MYINKESTEYKSFIDFINSPGKEENRQRKSPFDQFQDGHMHENPFAPKNSSKQATNGRSRSASVLDFNGSRELRSISTCQNMRRNNSEVYHKK